MGENSIIFDLATRIRAIYREIDDKTRAFQQKTGIKCLNGCGKCCLSPRVEAQVSEMLPLAMHLMASGDAGDVHAALENRTDAVCVLYRPNTHDATKGYCSAYEMRPSICRLFGFAAVPDKSPGKSTLSTCKTIKERDPEALQQAMDLIQADDHAVPNIRNFSLQIEVLALGTAFSERLPINAAIKVALEKLAILPTYITDMHTIYETTAEIHSTDLTSFP